MRKPIQITMPSSNTMHLMQGYQEVVDSLLWGLHELGYEAHFSPDTFRPDARHIILRGDAAPIALLKALPTDTIFYNIEQTYHLFLSDDSAEKFKTILESFIYIRQHFELWDYSTKNMEAMLAVASSMPLKHVPIGFAPILQRIERPQHQDIDVLIYGMPHSYRLDVFKTLCERGLHCLFLCGLYGSARDDLIGRSKIVLNLSGGEPESIFPVVRASYLLANRKLVLADFQPRLHYEPDMAQAVVFCATDNFSPTCKHYITNSDERLQAEEKGYSIMRRRDIRDILKFALQLHPQNLWMTTSSGIFPSV